MKLEERVGGDGRAETRRTRKGMNAAEMEREITQAQQDELSLGRMLRCRVKHVAIVLALLSSHSHWPDFQGPPQNAHDQTEQNIKILTPRPSNAC